MQEKRTQLWGFVYRFPHRHQPSRQPRRRTPPMASKAMTRPIRANAGATTKNRGKATRKLKSGSLLAYCPPRKPNFSRLLSSLALIPTMTGDCQSTAISMIPRDHSPIGSCSAEAWIAASFSDPAEPRHRGAAVYVRSGLAWEPENCRPSVLLIAVGSTRLRAGRTRPAVGRLVRKPLERAVKYARRN